MPPRRHSNPRRSRSHRSSRQSRASRLEGLRASIQELFSGRSTVGPRNMIPDSPKTPRFVLSLPNLSTTRLNVPYLTRTISNPTRSNSQRSYGSSGSPLQTVENPTTPISARPITPDSFRQQLQQPAASAVLGVPTNFRQQYGRRFVGVDPAEQHLVELVDAGRIRRRRKRTRRETTCARKIKNKRIRIKILCCFVSGLVSFPHDHGPSITNPFQFLTLVLTIYLALALSNKNESQEFHVLLILIILITTIFFCHSLIRLCMMLIHPPGERDLEQQLPSMVGPGGYANPQVPIRVALVRDEEAVGIESEATKLPPPAYGLWRESVVSTCSFERDFKYTDRCLASGSKSHILATK